MLSNLPLKLSSRVFCLVAPFFSVSHALLLFLGLFVGLAPFLNCKEKCTLFRPKNVWYCGDYCCGYVHSFTSGIVSESLYRLYWIFFSALLSFDPISFEFFMNFFRSFYLFLLVTWRIYYFLKYSLVVLKSEYDLVSCVIEEILK